MVQSVFQTYCRNFVTQIINLQSILDPEKFVIGGGISANPLLVITIRQERAIYNYQKSHHIDM